MKTLLIPSLAAALGLASAASAQVLMLDFGPTAAAGDDRLNSPYHTFNPSFQETGWNTLGIVDVTSGLKFSDGEDAPVTVELGTSSTTTINLATNPNNNTNLTGTVSNTEIYAGTAPGRDGIFQSTANAKIGVQIGGLSAGTYDVYVTARNTNTGTDKATYTQTIYAKAAAFQANSTFDFGSYDFETLEYTKNAVTNAASIYTSAWVEGENYVKFSVSITAANPFLNLAIAGAGSETRGILNSIQIVSTSQIPEPSSFAALAGLAGLGLAASRRRRA